MNIRNSMGGLACVVFLGVTLAWLVAMVRHWEGAALWGLSFTMVVTAQYIANDQHSDFTHKFKLVVLPFGLLIVVVGLLYRLVHSLG